MSICATCGQPRTGTAPFCAGCGARFADAGDAAGFGQCWVAVRHRPLADIGRQCRYLPCTLGIARLGDEALLRAAGADLVVTTLDDVAIEPLSNSQLTRSSTDSRQ